MHGVVPGPAALFDETRLLVLLEAAHADVLIVDRGAMIVAVVPRTREDVRATLARGDSIVVRRAERESEPLGALVAPLVEPPYAIGHVQAFVTPTDQWSFGWHYDLEDLLIVQTQGEKDYYFRRNTVVPEASLLMMRFESVARETSQMGACTLLAGDVLFVPRGWWHVARSRRSSWSLSIGLSM